MRGRADRKMLDEWVVEGRGGEVRGAFLFRPVSHQFERSQTKLFVSASDDREKRPSESPSFSPLLHHSGLLTWSVRRNSAWILSVQRPNVDVMRVASVLRGRHVRGLTFVWAKRNSKQRGWDGPSAGLPAGCLVGSTGLQSAIYRATCISSCLLFIFLVSRTAKGTGRACFAQLADSRKRSFPHSDKPCWFRSMHFLFLLPLFLRKKYRTFLFFSSASRDRFSVMFFPPSLRLHAFR